MEGRERARRAGVKMGRKPILSAHQIAEIRSRKAHGKSCPLPRKIIPSFAKHNFKGQIIRRKILFYRATWNTRCCGGGHAAGSVGAVNHRFAHHCEANHGSRVAFLSPWRTRGATRPPQQEGSLLTVLSGLALALLANGATAMALRAAGRLASFMLSWNAARHFPHSGGNS